MERFRLLKDSVDQCPIKEVLLGRTFLKEGFSPKPFPRTFTIAETGFSQEENAAFQD